ncbi:mercuric transporter MerT family protein [uncultured Sneathiella sp.]|jgi:mercuric ion transport protein|uniref:mercuric transporter MerT family protein n=1 Tax=uncultured Sneathiella sp. TaxID=879315 RepID=UPI0030DCE6AC|tara:strand:- start:177 stop:575 length:399 start_codon:yes stop_codon:yes gene_type:complete
MSNNETSLYDEPQRAESQKQGFLAAGGILGAIAASSCCILPLVLFSLGASGSWIGQLSALSPYQPVFIAFTFAFLGYGYYLVYWKPKKACADDASCARPLPSNIVKISLWAATVLVAAAIAFPYIAPLLLEP